jgi:hypothetical protein
VPAAERTTDGATRPLLTISGAPIKAAYMIYFIFESDYWLEPGWYIAGQECNGAFSSYQDARNWLNDTERNT